MFYLLEWIVIVPGGMEWTVESTLLSGTALPFEVNQNMQPKNLTAVIVFYFSES